VVHARGSVIRRDLLQRRQQIPLGKHLVKQSEPFASFHSLDESRQHANGPDARFGAAPYGVRRFGLLSQRHSRRGVFRTPGHSSSISLEPFARPALPGFLATMAPLTPARRCLVPCRSLCVMCLAFRPFRLQPPGVPRHRFSTLPLSVTGFRFRSGLRHLAAGSPEHPAESSSLSLRTSRSPPGTPHPASRRRSSVRLQAGERLLEKGFHLSDKTHLQTYCQGRVRPCDHGQIWVSGARLIQPWHPITDSTTVR